MAKTVKCPDCQAMFDPRGIHTHRAQRHKQLGAVAQDQALPQVTGTTPPRPVSGSEPVTPRAAAPSLDFPLAAVADGILGLFRKKS